MERYYNTNKVNTEYVQGILCDKPKGKVQNYVIQLKMNNMSFDAKNKDFKTWTSFFHENGYIILNNAIPNDIVQKLKEDLQKVNHGETSKKKKTGTRHVVHNCFFEKSTTMVDLIEDSLISDFAQHVINDVPGGRGNSLTMHLIHNNAYIVPPNGRGQAPSWHIDDPLQNIVVPEGKSLPNWIKLPVMVVTYMIWLSDCTSPENGPTHIVPGSHRFGRIVDSDKAETKGVAACGKSGTVVLINSQTWHRGSENKSNIPRETIQVTFGRRIIGHKHKTIMNYVMPNHVLKNKDEKTKERFGFLQGGAYS